MRRIIGVALAVLIMGSWKIPGAGGGELSSGGSFVEREVLVRFVDGTTEARKAEIREGVGAWRVRVFPAIGVEHWRLPEDRGTADVVARLQEMPDVLYAEPNYLYTPHAMPDDPLFDQAWYLNNTGQAVNGFSGTAGADISAPEAWEIETGNPELVIAVIDSGVAFEHPDLIDNTWINSGESPENGLDDDANGYVDDRYGWDFVNEDANPSDYSRDLYGDGHGTHVAGLIAGRGHNGIGIAGVMWQARIMALQVFDLYETNSFQDAIIQNDNIIRAMTYAVDNGARIINCSFGGPSGSQSLRDMIAYADQKGVLVVAAAGNEGEDNDAVPNYPAGFDLPNIISVAATDENDRLADYSNYGATTVDVAAPGGSRYSNMHSTIPPKREVMFREDFENGDDNWVKNGVFQQWSVIYDSEFDSHVIRDSPANYHTNEDSYIQLATPLNSDRYRGLYIEFKALYALEANRDYLQVEGSTDGVNFSTDYPVTGFITGFSSGIEKLFALDSDTELGPVFYLRFRIVTDAQNNFDGVIMDDIELTGIRWEFDGSEYGFKSGSSMAAPVVAGVAGLLWSRWPEWTHYQVKAAILDSVDFLPDLAGRVVSGGRVNAARALELKTESDSGGGGGCFIQTAMP